MRVGHSLPLAAACWWCHFQPLWPWQYHTFDAKSSTILMIYSLPGYCLSLGNQAMHASPTCPQMVPPSLFPNHMAFAFRTQCYPEGPGQSGLSSHCLPQNHVLRSSWELEEQSVRVLLLSSTSALCSAICCIPLLTATASGKHQDV